MSPNTLEPVTQVSTFAVEILDFLRLKQSGLSVAQNKAEQICTFMTQVQQQVQDLTRKNEDLERQVIAKDRELDVYYESLPTLQAKLHGAEQATSELRVLYKHVDAERLRYIEQCGRVDGFNMVLRKEDDDLRKQLYQLDMQPTTPRDLVTSGLIPSKESLKDISNHAHILGVSAMNTSQSQPPASARPKIKVRLPSPRPIDARLPAPQSSPENMRTIIDAIVNKPSREESFSENIARTNQTFREAEAKQTSKEQAQANLKALNPECVPFVPLQASISPEFPMLRLNPLSDVFVPTGVKNETAKVPTVRPTTPPHKRIPKIRSTKENLPPPQDGDPMNSLYGINGKSTLPSHYSSPTKTKIDLEESLLQLRLRHIPLQTRFLSSCTEGLPIPANTADESSVLSYHATSIHMPESSTWSPYPTLDKTIPAPSERLSIAPANVATAKIATPKRIPPHLRAIQPSSPVPAKRNPIEESVPKVSLQVENKVTNLSEASQSPSATTMPNGKKNSKPSQKHFNPDSVTRKWLDESELDLNSKVLPSDASTPLADKLIDLWGDEVLDAERIQRAPTPPGFTPVMKKSTTVFAKTGLGSPKDVKAMNATLMTNAMSKIKDVAVKYKTNFQTNPPDLDRGVFDSTEQEGYESVVINGTHELGSLLGPAEKKYLIMPNSRGDWIELSLDWKPCEKNGKRAYRL
ncbi:hypothetical protein MMC21_006893 [Puttea exsequens]|nr:hypothetical protein [Puttea exsequens]